MKLRVKDNALDHAGKFEHFTIEPPVACYEPYLNRNSLETSPFIYKLLAITDTFKKFSCNIKKILSIPNQHSVSEYLPEKMFKISKFSFNYFWQKTHTQK